jgi:hypothetical protein
MMMMMMMMVREIYLSRNNKIFVFLNFLCFSLQWSLLLSSDEVGL